MKNAFKIFALIVSLAGCAAEQLTVTAADGSDVSVVPELSLADKVQALVVEKQSVVTSALPDEIVGLKSVEPVANREDKQRGAGFTKAYVLDDSVVTVFVYNNRDFGVQDGVTPALESLMDETLKNFQSMQDARLYENVQAGQKKTRDFKWRGVKYQVLEAEVGFSKNGEQKKSFVVLGANKDLMSYIRITFTYPKSDPSGVAKNKNTFTRTIFTTLRDFGAPASENGAR